MAHAALIRAQVPAKDQVETIASQIPNLVKRDDYSAAADLAVEYSAQSGNDEVLAGFLTSQAARRNKAIARDLAAKIFDESRRAEVLDFLK